MVSQACSASLGLTHVTTYYVPGLVGSIEDVQFNDIDSDGSPEILACDGEALILYSPKTDIVHLEKPLDPRQIDYALTFEDINHDLIPDVIIGCYFEAGSFGPDTVCMLEFFDGAAGYSTSDSLFFEAQIELPAKDVINITVTKRDSIYVDYVEIAEINIEGQLVRTTVRRVKKCDSYNVSSEINKARAKNLRALIVIKADRDASFGVLDDVMSSMQENHLERFLIITDKEIETAEG